MSNMDTPFNMSFDDLLAKVGQAETAPPVTETNPQVSNPPASPAGETATEPASGGEMTFEALVAQAQAQAASTMSETGTNPPVTESKTETNTAASESVPETPAVNETSAEDPVAETPAKEKAEDAAAESMSETPAVNETASEESAAEVPVEEKKDATGPETAENNMPAESADKSAKTESKPKRRPRKKKKDAETEVDTANTEEMEKPEDQTENYRVDLLGDDTKSESPTANITGMDALFTPAEVAAIRADIRKFVRKEFKMAVVDAMKELLNDFGN